MPRGQNRTPGLVSQHVDRGSSQGLRPGPWTLPRGGGAPNGLVPRTTSDGLEGRRGSSDHGSVCQGRFLSRAHGGRAGDREALCRKPGREAGRRRGSERAPDGRRNAQPARTGRTLPAAHRPLRHVSRGVSLLSPPRPTAGSGLRPHLRGLGLQPLSPGVWRGRPASLGRAGTPSPPSAQNESTAVSARQLGTESPSSLRAGGCADVPDRARPGRQPPPRRCCACHQAKSSR